MVSGKRCVGEFPTSPSVSGARLDFTNTIGVPTMPKTTFAHLRTTDHSGKEIYVIAKLGGSTGITLTISKNSRKIAEFSMPKRFIDELTESFQGSGPQGVVKDAITGKLEIVGGNDNDPS